MDKLFLTTNEAAELLSLGRNNVLGLCRSRYKDFPAVKIERKYLINAKMLAAWAERVANEGDDLSA